MTLKDNGLIMCVSPLLILNVPRRVEYKESYRGEYQYHSKVELLSGGLS